jgi:hypothetical protein
MKRIATVTLVGLLSLTVSSTVWWIPQVFSRLRAGLAGPVIPGTPPAGDGGPAVAWHIDFSIMSGARLRRGSKPKASN